MVQIEISLVQRHLRCYIYVVSILYKPASEQIVYLGN